MTEGLTAGASRSRRLPRGMGGIAGRKGKPKTRSLLGAGREVPRPAPWRPRSRPNGRQAWGGGRGGKGAAGGEPMVWAG
jgi:hypothetical protein